MPATSPRRVSRCVGAGHARDQLTTRFQVCRSGPCPRPPAARQDNHRPTGVFQRKFMSFFMPSAFFCV